MQQFKVFRAIGLAFKAWFANFIPITLLAAILYAPVVAWAASLPTDEGGLTLEALNSFNHIIYLMIGVSALVAPFVTYRVIQYMNGTSSSILTSVKFGFRGIIPVLIFAAVTNVLQLIPFGAIVAVFVQCYWFVCGPAAVAERLNPIAALGRSSALTQGRRGGIFGLSFLIGLSLVVIVMVMFAPMITSPREHIGEFKHMVMIIVPIMCTYQLFLGIVQAVSYSLLRADKDGVSNEELAKVFE